MVHPSQSTDRPFRNRPYKYHNYHNRNKPYNTNNTTYNGQDQSHSRYNVSRYNNDISRYNNVATDNKKPVVSPTFQRANNVSNAKSYEIFNYNNPNRYNKSARSTHTSTPLQTRYQPHVYTPPPVTPGANPNHHNNNMTTNGSGNFHKSRYDPTIKVVPAKTSYHSPNQWRKSRFQDTSFNETYHNTFPPYRETKKQKHSNPYRNSQSSITQSYIRPQAKIRNVYSHNNIQTDYGSIVPTPRRLSNYSNNVSLEPDTITSIDTTNTPLSPASENEKNLSNKDTNTSVEYKHSEDLDETSDNDVDTETLNLNLNFNSQSQLHDYTHINDPQFLKTNISELIIDKRLDYYPQDCPTYSAYIFPMNKIQTKLWNLKYKLKNKEVERPKYMQDHPFTSLSQYPSYSKVINNIQAFQSCLNLLTGLKHIIIKNKLYYRKKYNEDKIIWNKQCEISKHEDEKAKAKVDLPTIENKTNSSIDPTDSFDSSRLNRRDYVNDDELDSILCEIDPGYKFNKQAARIPCMIPNPLQRNQVQFVNVNNLYTDKNKWALRLLSDKIDTFTKHEHDLFCTGYLRFPKIFDKISHYMGGLRTPEDCVLHYYKTKKTVNYKKLIKERNMRRINRSIKSAKKIDTVNYSKDTTDTAYSSGTDSIEEEEEEEEQDMEEDGNLDDSAGSDI